MGRAWHGRRERGDVVHLFGVSPAAVCYEAALAAALRAGGVDVVLCRADATAGAPVAGGRIAVFVGDPEDDEETALAMARELFGGDPVVVRTESEAARLIAGVPGSGQASSGTVDSHP
jgi:hypothetical protein